MGTGATAFNTLGVMYLGWIVDATYHIVKEIPHTGSSFQATFAGSGMQEVSDEGWGLDNVSVSFQ